MSGFWQDYYDQAFHVELDNGLRFIANFRYELRDKFLLGKQLSLLNITYLNEVIPNTEEETKAKFNSKCDETMVGFMQDKNEKGSFAQHPVTCFYA